MGKAFDPYKFSFLDYITEFDFCDKHEKERVYNAIVRAWLWGTCGV